MTAIRRIEFAEHGGPEVLRLAACDAPAPGPGEILVRIAAAGLNFIDTYHRSGLYPVPSLPSGLGLEGAGTVEAVGDGVDTFAPGDRAAFCSGPVGAYAEAHVVKAERAVRLPDGVGFEDAAATMLKGLTVQYLIRQIRRVGRGDTVLFHAAAGGVGLIAMQWLRHLGAEVIGTVGSDEKAARARANGCDHVIFYDREDIAARVREITGGEGVPVVYDGVGKSTWLASLDSLQPKGLMVSFGNASGPVTNVNLGDLASRGSLFVTRPVLFHYTDTREALQAAADDLFEVMRSGAVKPLINQRYSLDEAAQAHRDLEARKTTGSTLILP